MTGELEGASRPGRESMKATRILLGLMMTLAVLSCTNETEEMRETLRTAIDDIERVQQENIDILRELADNHKILERTPTALRMNLEERTRTKLHEYEEIQKSTWLDDYRKQVEEGNEEELREVAGHLNTERSNLRYSIGMMGIALENTRKRVAAKKSE